jgi:hypothetical protein
VADADEALPLWLKNGRMFLTIDCWPFSHFSIVDCLSLMLAHVAEQTAILELIALFFSTMTNPQLVANSNVRSCG